MTSIQSAIKEAARQQDAGRHITSLSFTLQFTTTSHHVTAERGKANFRRGKQATPQPTQAHPHENKPDAKAKQPNAQQKMLIILIKCSHYFMNYSNTGYNRQIQKLKCIA